MDIKIRKPKFSDAESLRQLINDREIIKQLWGYPYPCPLNRIKKDVQDAIKGWRTGSSFAFTILADGEVVGSVILEYPSDDKGRYDIGYFVGTKFSNQGIATEAVKQVVDFGFKKLKLYRIQGDTDSDYPASGRVLKKAGFKLEGVKKKFQKKKNKFVDSYMWGITK